MDKDKDFDVVIVGAGISGAITANELAKKGYSVLILEAGVKKSNNYQSYLSYLDTYYNNMVKIPNSPFPNNPDAPQPLVTDAQQIVPGTPDTTGYFVQNGPQPFQSTYTRSKGGTTLHWLGTCLRMLPDDFKEKERYGTGLDWPISYEELMPYYRKAEHEIGVSACVEDQTFHGVHFEKDYVYPMKKVPQSYLDQKLGDWADGFEFQYEGESYEVDIVSTPQGRNSTPNPNYDGGKGYQPVGAVGNPDLGQRCEGNSACVPICPVQAKYNALKTLKKAVETGQVKIWSQCVVTELTYDTGNGHITGVKYKKYKNPNSGKHKEKKISAKRYVLATHAVENAKIMLASGLYSTSGLMGKNLMDHPVLLTWGLAPEKVGALRGPGSTSGIPTMRGGDFRSNFSPFRVEIGNWGWNWPDGSPFTQLNEALSTGNMFGDDLKQHMFELNQRMFRFGFLIEQQPAETNQVTIDPAYKDQLGNYRPVINYDISDHEIKGMVAAKEFTKQFFQAAGIDDQTQYNPTAPGYMYNDGNELWWQGAGHLAGTHIMGTNAKNSVVDKNQKCWDYDNLYMIGCGSMPTVSTSNPTLTMAAITFMAAEQLILDLEKESILV
ncbi:MAG: GMC family oxidoreductase [Roseivirga sp.]|nr:GMC family oxidoreductase [Roseivirga sp.]